MTSPATAPTPSVLVVIGTGGMGKSIARRLGSGRTVLLADFSETALTVAADELRGDGYLVQTSTVDVSDPGSVDALAHAAAALGSVVQVAHTAGLSPVQAPLAAILAVDLVGVALVLDAFGEVVAPGGAGVVIASMAGHTSPPLTAEQEAALALTPAQDLRSLPFLTPDVLTDPGAAYGLSKRGNQLRVQAASGPWGDRGARINSISPGIISTPMGQQELTGPAAGFMQAMTAGSGLKRLGSPNDITSAAAFLLGPDSAFITGTDLLVDGGVIAALRTGRTSSSADPSPGRPGPGAHSTTSAAVQRRM